MLRFLRLHGIAADAAVPQSDEEAAALKRAEETGKSHAKGEDPTVPGAYAAIPAKK